METTTTRISVETKKRLKVYAATNDTSMLDVLELAISLVIDGLPNIDRDQLANGVYIAVDEDGNSFPMLIKDGLLADVAGIDGEIFVPECWYWDFYGPIPVPK